MNTVRSHLAGSWYPGSAPELGDMLGTFAEGVPSGKAAKGIIAPHAGYAFSGRTAARLYAGTNIPGRIIVIGPDHSGLSKDMNVLAEGGWETPFGRLDVDEELASLIADGLGPGSAQSPSGAVFSMPENSLELQMPMIKYFSPGSSIVPIKLGGRPGGAEKLAGFAGAVASAVRDIGEEVLIVASSDMSHESGFIPEEIDKGALSKITSLDPGGFYSAVTEDALTICGAAAVTVMLYSSIDLGASAAELVDYSTSYDVTKDSSYVVGYAAVRIY